ncbi:MAG: YggT family protein [Clostridia bacterium]|nr:YggT family protein [Clostridia bacterium]MDD4798836.1 YggT family protein [Clostridia bacterium]
MVFEVYYALIFIRIILSWLPKANNFFTNFIYEMTEPLLGLCRRILPPNPNFPLDFSPIIALVGLALLRSLLVMGVLALGLK